MMKRLFARYCSWLLVLVVALTVGGSCTAQESDTTQEKSKITARIIGELPLKGLGSKHRYPYADGLCFSPDCKYLAFSTEKGTYLWKLGDRQAKRIGPLSKEIAWVADSRIIFLDGKPVKIDESLSDKEIKLYSSPRKYVVPYKVEFVEEKKELYVSWEKGWKAGGGIYCFRRNVSLASPRIRYKFSPSGRRCVVEWSEEHGEEREYYTILVDEINPGRKYAKVVPLTCEDIYTPQVVWHHSEKFFLFNSGDASHHQLIREDLCLMNTDTWEVTRLTFGNLNEDPVWSPNGAMIVYRYSKDRDDEAPLLRVMSVKLNRPR